MEISLSSAIYLTISACNGIILDCVEGKESNLDIIYNTLNSIKEVIEKFKSCEQDEDTISAIDLISASYRRALDAVEQRFGSRVSLN